MSIENIIKEVLAQNPVGLKEAFADEIRSRISYNLTEGFHPDLHSHIHDAVKEVQARSKEYHKAASAEDKNHVSRYNDHTTDPKKIANEIISKKNFGNKTIDHMYDNHKISPGFMKAVKERVKETSYTAGVSTSSRNDTAKTNAKTGDERRTARAVSHLSRSNAVGRMR